MTRCRGIQSGVALLALVAIVSACRGALAGRPVVTATRATVLLTAESTGDLRVSEQFEVPAAVEVFSRRVAPHTADGVTFVSGTVDDTPLSAEASDPAFRVHDGSALELSIRLPTGAGAVPHRIELQYVAHHAVAVVEGHGVLEWPMFGGDELAIDAATMTLAWPDGQHETGANGIAEAGWTVSRTPRGITASRAAPGREPATVVASFSIDPARTPMPDWQVADDLRREFAPAFVSGALFVLVIGAGVLWMLRFKYPRVILSSGPPVAPLDLPPADLSALLLPPRAWPGRSLDDDDVVRLERAGLLDRERLAAAAGLRWSGLVCAGFSLACLAAAAVLLPRFGWWAHLIPVSMLAVSVLFVVAAPWLGVLTERGLRARRSATAGEAGRRAGQ